MKYIKFLNKLVLFILCCSFFTNFAFANNTTNTHKTTVTIVQVDDGEYYDIEIMQLNNENILLPTKQIADIINIPININHETKEIIFSSLKTKSNIKINKKSVLKNNKKISENNIFLKSGMMDEIRDEIFCSANILSKAFEAEIIVNKNDLSIQIKTNDNKSNKQKNIKTTNNKKEETSYKAYSEITKPRKLKKITLDTIEMNNTAFSDAATQIYRNTRSKNIAFNNSGSLRFRGSAFGGDWEANTLLNNYKGELFSFSGMNFRYLKEHNNKFYEVGKITGLESENNNVGSGILGLQVSNFNRDKTKNSIQNIEGEVSPKSLVNVYVNNKFYKTISTYNGYYTLSDLYIQDAEIKNIELKELKEDGNEISILKKDLPKYSNNGLNLKEKEKHKTFFAGVSGYDDRLFAQNGYFYQNNSKKYVLGAEEKYAIKDNLISSSSITYDKIFAEDKNSIWAESIYNNSSILSMGTYKNPNSLEGITISNTLDWIKNNNLKLQSDFKMSLAKNINSKENLLGYSGEIRSIYEKNNLRLLCGLYNQSPDFYLAGSRYGFISDRLGARIGGNYQYKNWNFNGQYNKYLSNTLKKYDGGIIDFDELNFNLSGRIKDFAQIRYKYNTRIGENNLGKLSNTFQDINISKNFRNGLLVEGGENFSKFSSLNLANLNNNSFTSDYSTMYLKAGYQIPKNKGRIELGHDITEYSSNGYNNEYKMFKVNYTFPELKRFLISLGTGYKYAGKNKGFNYSASIGYRTKTGMVVSLMYRYDTDMGYMFDDIYMPTSQRHSINLVFNNIFAVTPNGLKSVGQSSSEKGFVEVCAYLDKNENNIFDKGDIGIEDVPFKISNIGKIYTTKKNGKTDLASTNKGVYKVTLNEENLNCNLSLAKTEKLNKRILIKPQKQTLVSYKLISSVGNIKGNLKIIDDFGRNHPIQDFIVVINDKNGKEVNYSTVDSLGNYYFSGISPGEYEIKLDKNFIKKYNLKDYEDKGKIKVNIPYEYKNIITLNDQNLIYQSW